MFWTVKWYFLLVFSISFDYPYCLPSWFIPHFIIWHFLWFCLSISSTPFLLYCFISFCIFLFFCVSHSIMFIYFMLFSQFLCSHNCHSILFYVSPLYIESLFYCLLNTDFPFISSLWSLNDLFKKYFYYTLFHVFDFNKD